MPRQREEWTPELLESPHDVPDKAGRVRRMFDGIAPRYDLVNTLCSAGRDAYWRRRAVQLAGASASDYVLDVACGTGHFARAFQRAGVRGVVGSDFSHAMLMRARLGCAANDARGRTKWCEADAMALPFRSSSFTIASCAFGVRNFVNLEKSLREMHRVLAPGGRAVVLEFSRPKNPVARRVYELYSHRLMPTLATLISGDRSGAYRYLPRSVVSFTGCEEIKEMLRGVGFRTVTSTPLTLGIVTVYVARR